MTNVVIISGPGEKAFDNSRLQKLASAMRSCDAEVELVGDGEHPVDKEALKKTLDGVARKSTERVTLFIMAHGEVKSGKHVIDIDGKHDFASGELFDAVNHSFGGKPVDVFMTSCYGGAAIPEVNKLPAASTLAVLAAGSEPVAGGDVNRLVDAIQAGDFSARHLLDLYLGKALETRYAPSLAISGQGVRDLPREFEARIGKPFLDDERTAAHMQLDPIMGAARVDDIVEKISGAQTDRNIIARDFGAALAVTLASTNRMQELSSYDPNRGSYRGAGKWTLEVTEDGLTRFRGGERTAPRPRPDGWSSQT